MMNYKKAPAELFFLTALFAGEEEPVYSEARIKSPGFKPGDVLEVPFPYTDLSGFKTRPVLVLAVSKTDVTVAFLSTHLSWQAFEDMIILPTKENGLQNESLLRTGKLFSIAPDIVQRKIGQIQAEDLSAALWCLKGYFSGSTWPATGEEQITDDP
jgi:mRNA interferase MazF